MTRETKIGLLVGLAFIIVIGILLSDHMATTTEPTQAVLDTAADRARTAIVVPNESRNGAVIPQNINPRDITPAGQVPTRTEVVQAPVVHDVQIGGPANPGNSTAARGTPPINGNTQVADASVTGPSNAGPTSVEPTNANTGNTTSVDPRLIAAGQNAGEELVNVGTNGRPSTVVNGSSNTPNGNTARPAPPAEKTYTVQAGDTLGRIASKAMGANSKANRDAIVKANPSLQANPDKVVLGATYTIPTAAVAPSTPGTQTAGNTRVLPLQPVTPPTNTRESRDARDARQPSSATQAYTYTVKSGDNLYAIAREQLGNSQAVAAIKDLNREVLKGGDVVRVGMRLKLPAKPVASAN